MSENKKIIGARKVLWEGLQFDSILEKNLYKMLVEEGFKPELKPKKTVLMEGFYPNKVQYYCRYKKKGEIREVFRKDDRKIQSITYTFDMSLSYKDYTILFEAKGFPNDRYPLKKKLFFNILEHSGAGDEIYIFFEPKSVRDIKECIRIIKNLP